MTPDKIARFCPAAIKYIDGLLVAFDEWGIDTSKRQAAFLAQVAHESGGFRYVREIWGPTPAQAKYEGRADLGNTHPGDGIRFKGRGLIQITGRANYYKCSIAVFGNDVLIEHPDMLEMPDHACASAGWFWNSKNLNQYADSDDFTTLTKRINGGLNGIDDRLKWWEKAKAIINSGGQS